jgi:hypothetical protein
MNWIPTEIQYVLYEPNTRYMSLIYNRSSKQLHVDIQYGLTSGSEGFPAKQAHKIISVVFEAKQITMKVHK